ncbi:NUDIX hydrolase [Polaribacter sargassicola]|uniref:NUDIX hydrolase n=1 Tax=Polaribacter sargassicola TaxID=2836891 RepID=UPI001F22DEDF|nr:NUDIX domain-containing protein [Polaribacter sp. DS7-9]MCG1035605.1 NUDIX domain-containing protein [Polaribacter sp. DS7-9]
MYKVFVNEKPIIITSSRKDAIFSVFLFKEIHFDEIINKLENTDIKGIILYSNNLESDWKSFLTHLKMIPAAGGLVLNSKKDILFIYRNGVWDLPKGWIEKNESIENAAIREVEEECGITNIKIIKPLITTYHIYFHKGAKLKKTHWFLMTSDFNGVLKPQTEEGITQASFKNSFETEKALQNTYQNIKLVYDTYKES